MKNDTLRFIQDLQQINKVTIQNMQPINKVTIQNAGIRPTIDEFVEAFAVR